VGPLLTGGPGRPHLLPPPQGRHSMQQTTRHGMHQRGLSQGHYVPPCSSTQHRQQLQILDLKIYPSHCYAPGPIIDLKIHPSHCYAPGPRGGDSASAFVLCSRSSGAPGWGGWGAVCGADRGAAASSSPSGGGNDSFGVTGRRGLTPSPWRLSESYEGFDFLVIIKVNGGRV
jgi:hypothetical protein